MDLPGVRVRDARIPRNAGGDLPARVYDIAENPAVATLVLAHGAGAPQAHPFMVKAARALATRELAVVTFDFPYMAERRKLPDRAPVLERAYLDVIAWVRAQPDLPRPLTIGGKSMGGRMASHVAALHAESAGPLCGLVFLGYPLHPPAKPEQRRDAHLPRIMVPMLFVQGSRDTFGTPDELRPVMEHLGDRAMLRVVDGGDHGFAIARGHGESSSAALSAIWDDVATWIRARS